LARTYERIEQSNAELQAVNKELEAFSYSVSHDLRAPLRSIDGFSQVLQEDYTEHLDETGRDCTARIRRSAQYMGALIDDMLNLARVTQSELTRSQVDLSAQAREIVEKLRLEVPHRAVEIEIANGIEARGDAHLLRIALTNLLNNAWKFTAGRSPARVEFGKETVNGETSYFVRDNGVGFDMAYVGKLFGAFQRLHDVREFPGTGVGLATVQRIISKHGGHVWAKGEPGRGATFYFTL
jgi:light-regulated signal transduction histidine kinase (bacteriophytochrome)